jgi:hypothetical protein
MPKILLRYSTQTGHSNTEVAAYDKLSAIERETSRLVAPAERRGRELHSGGLRSRQLAGALAHGSSILR